MRAVSIYVHIPFCARRCPYCDFHSCVAGEPDIGREIGATVEAIRAEARRDVRVETIYIGGGTPSFVASHYIADILRAIRESFDVAEGAEVSIEVNPNSIDEEKLRAYKEAGVNRVSIGVQSFSNRGLRVLGRLHNVAEAKRAIRLAVGVFDNVSIDLIHSVPGVRVVLPRRYLKKVQHVSAYSLTLHEGSERGGLWARVDEGWSIREQGRIERALRRCGIYKYEVSNFARPGFECRHNLVYWRCGEWLGFGTGAVGHFDEPWTDDDRVMLGLRLVEGVARGLLNGRERELAELEGLGLIEVTDERVRCTEKGFLLLNQVILRLTR